MFVRDWLVQALADPNVAYLLLVIGAVGLIAEFFNVGSVFPGAIGAIALLVAYVALSTLGISWLGVFLLVVAIGLFAVDLHRANLGVLSAAGMVAFVAGSLTLFSPLSSTASGFEVRINPWLIAAVTAGLCAFLRLALVVVRTTRAPAASGAESMMGRVGVAVSDLAPYGQARVDAELWGVVSESGQIRAGEELRVVGIDGLTLKVRRSQ
jgi:membrane-bound serine protease (ClpP class)